MYLAILGYLMLIAFVVLLMKEKSVPAVVFVALPLIAGVLAGYDLSTLQECIKTGVSGVANNIFLFCFAILFFTIMSEVGLFTPIIRFIMRYAGKSLPGICIATALVALVGHLDGSATTTIFITLPFFAPVFKKLKLDPCILVLLVGTTMGIMNLMPWAGTVLRIANVTGQDPGYLWQRLLPMQIAGLVAIILYCIILGRRAMKKDNVVLGEALTAEPQEESKPITWKFYCNLVITVATIAVLALTKYMAYIVFMVACCLALVLNYKGQKAQLEVIRKAAPPAFFVIITMITSGVFIGILNYGEPSILSSMADVLLSILPAALVKHLQLVIAVFSVPFGLLFSGDAYLYGVLPLCIQMGSGFGVSGEALAYVMAIGDSISIIGSPVYPATYLILGLANVDLREYLKFAFLPMWLISLIMIAFGILIGTIPL